jgi:mannose-6-phosphate isomerase-like protein (cupin superfamily)
MTFSIDITQVATENTAFRKVLSTGPNAQLVVMRLRPGEEIGDEVHEHVDQLLSFVAGHGVAVIEGEERPVGPGILVHVPAGVRHNVVNRGPMDLRLSTVYAPPQHPAGTIHATKAHADRAEEAERLVAAR